MKKILAILLAVLMLGQLAAINVFAEDGYTSLVDANTKSYYTYNSVASNYVGQGGTTQLTDGDEATVWGRGQGYAAVWIDLGALKHVDKVVSVINDQYGTGDGMTWYATTENPSYAMQQNDITRSSWKELGTLTSTATGRHEVSFTLEDDLRYRYVVCVHPTNYNVTDNSVRPMSGYVAEIIPYTNTAELSAPADFSGMDNVAQNKAAMTYYSADGTDPRLALDGDAATGWTSVGSVGSHHDYLVIDLGAFYPVYGIGLLPAAADSARNLTIYGANEVMFGDKVQLAAVGTQVSSTTEMTNLTAAASGPYRYIIFDQLSGQPALGFNEIAVYSLAAAGTNPAETGAVSLLSHGKQGFISNDPALNDAPSITDNRSNAADDDPSTKLGASVTAGKLCRVMVDLGVSMPLSHIVYQSVATGQTASGVDFRNDYAANFLVVATNNENFISNDYVVLGSVSGRPVLSATYDTGLWVFPVPEAYRDTAYRYIGIVKPTESPGQSLNRLQAHTLQAYARAEDVIAYVEAQDAERLVLSESTSVTDTEIGYAAEVLNGSSTGRLLGLFTQYDDTGAALQKATGSAAVPLAGAYNSISLNTAVTGGATGTWDAALIDGQTVAAYMSNLASGTKPASYPGAASGTATYSQTGITASVTGSVGAGVLGMVILNPGAALADFDAADIYDFEIITAPEAATAAWDYSFRYTMPETAPVGAYTIGFVSDTGALTGESFTLTMTDVAAMKADFADVTADTFMTLMTTYSDFYGSALVDELTAAEAATGNVGESFMLAKEGFTTGLFNPELTDWSNANTIAAAAEAALVIDASLAGTGIQAAVAAHGAAMPAVFDNPDYNGAEFEQLLPSVLAANPATTAQGLVDAYNRTIALSLIANGTAAEAEKAITDYSTELGISAETLNTTQTAYAISQQLTTDISAVKTLYAGGMDAVVAGIITELDTPEDTSKDLGYSGGGGRGSSGRGSSGGIVASIPRDPTVTLPEAAANETGTSSDAAEEAPAADFTDLADYDWAEADIKRLVGRGVIAGQGDGTYNPEGLLTREQSVKMLVLSLGLATDQTYNGYLDCTMGAWYYPYITSAKANGLVNGLSRTEFGLGQLMTREDLAVTIYRALLKYGAVDGENLASFPDEETISEYARDAANVLGGMGIITGFPDGSFGPKETATRAQAAVIYSRFLDVIDAVKAAKEAEAE